MSALLFLRTFWREAVVVLLLGAVFLFVRQALDDRRTLQEMEVRAIVADSVIAAGDRRVAKLQETIDSLAVREKAAQVSVDSALAALNRRRVIVPTPVTERADSTVPPDNIDIETDTIPLSEIPEVANLVQAFKNQIALKDATIGTLRAQLKEKDDQIITLRSTVRPPVTVIEGPSKMERVLTGALSGAAGALVGQQVAGDNGLYIGAGVGVLINIFK